MEKITIQEAKAQGYAVDQTCYSHVAYKGPRFAPDEWRCVFTETEGALLDALTELCDLVDDWTSSSYKPDTFTTQPARAAIAKAKEK